MSVRVSAAAWKMRMPPVQKLVLLRLADAASDDGGSAYPSAGTIAEDTGLSERAVRKALADLRDAGIIAVQRPATAKTATVYRVLTCTTCTPEQDAPLHDVHPTPAPHAPQGCTTCTLTVLEPSFNQNSPPEVPPAVIEPDEIAEAVEAWNAGAGGIGLAKVQKITDSRRQKLRARLRDCGGIEGWRTAIARIRGSPFLRGENDRGWKADFDFLLRPDRFTKLMEGGYDRSNAATSRTGPATRARKALLGPGYDQVGEPEFFDAEPGVGCRQH